MQLGILENNNLYLEYCPDVGGSIFKFQAKVKDNKIDISDLNNFKTNGATIRFAL